MVTGWRIRSSRKKIKKNRARKAEDKKEKCLKKKTESKNFCFFSF
jgi:hypothetical protein